MAPTIAEQVHKDFVRREEERCLERERITGKKVKRKEVPIPVVRLGPEALCQNIEHLLLVTEYDYDLSHRKFQDYCASRGSLQLAGIRGTTLWQYHADHSLSKDAYLADPYFQFAQEHEGTRHKYTPKDMDVQWKIIRLSRATFQDCWELFKGRGRGEAERPKQKRPPRKTKTTATGGSRQVRERARRKDPVPVTARLDFGEPDPRDNARKPRKNKQKTG
ncbi:MAG: hypothetical protein NTV05_08115 [Acidobacteria bacterium]|nr:hypothetical protein [Acidobacteriota bacterium]